MEFLVEFDIRVPDGTPVTEVEERTRAEAAAAEKLVEEGCLLRVWTRDTPSGATTVLGLYRADGRAELDQELHDALLILSGRGAVNTRPPAFRTRELGQVGRSVPACSATMYEAYQAGQSSSRTRAASSALSRCLVRFSCSP